MTKQIFLFVITFLLIIVLSEIFIRNSRIASVSSTEFYKDIGRGRRGNLDFLYFNEGFGINKFNEYRFIGEEIPLSKSENTFRVILMGDSYVEAFQVFNRDYFGNIAENILELKYLNQHFEFLNFGRSGFDIADMYAYQKLLAEKFNPDYIFYMISEGDLEPKYSDPLRPKTILENDSLKIDLHFSSIEKNKFVKTKYLFQYSSILNMLNNGRKRIKVTPISAILLEKVYTWLFPTDDNHYLKEELVFRINPVTERIVKSLDPESIVFINRDMQQLPWKFEKLCIDNGFKYLDLCSMLDSMKVHGNDPIEWKITKKIGHWNHAAHYAIGVELADNLTEIIESKQYHKSK